MTNVALAQTELLSPPTGLDAAVGNTPLLPLQRATHHLSRGVQVFAKAEWFTPGGSVKDRPALNILKVALAEGRLHEGKRLLDSTSGNMGISYATFAAALGVPLTLAIPANASPERLKILRTMGVEVVLTDPLEGSDGAIMAARNMADEAPERYYYADQYNNPANWQAHYNTTAPEIVGQTSGRITHFVAGLGTTGTMTGVGRYLRQYNPAIQLIAVQPDDSFHGLEGLKHIPTSLKPGIFDPSLPDLILEISTEEAYEMVLRLAREEGLFVGVSSGAAAAAALRIAAEIDQGVVVAIFPDSGYKYLSEKFWDEMS